MKIRSVKTKAFNPPQDNLDDLIQVISENLTENSIVAIASKVIAICEGRCIPFEEYPDKDDLVKKEADKYLERDQVPNKWIMHTLKNNLLIGAAGIDESNGNNFYILWPENPDKSVEEICQKLKSKTNIKNFGIIITDSHSIPMRRGLIGIALSYFGFAPLKDYRGKEDIFGKELVLSMTNIPDSLAATAVFEMGEGNEQTPVVILEDLPDFIEFIDKKWETDEPYSNYIIAPEEDLFKPFLTSVPWKSKNNQ